MRVYADNAATTAVSQKALEAMTACMRENSGNPSSLHQEGRKAALALEDARARIAVCLGARPEELYFTS